MDNELMKQYNELMEHLIKTADKVAIREKEYQEEKQNLELLKAQYVLKNDWENILGKKKPTVAEKESYIKIETEEQERKVNELKVLRDYCRRIFEINMEFYKKQ